jgi:hypothetical protein
VSTQNSIFGEVFLDAIRQAVRKEIQAAANGRKESSASYPGGAGGQTQDPGHLGLWAKASKKIPTHRLGLRKPIGSKNHEHLTFQKHSWRHDGLVKSKMTREEIERQMDKLARKYLKTHDPEIVKELYRLSRKLQKMEKGDWSYADVLLYRL